MTTDDQRPGGDPVRDLLLGLAGQIDQLAGFLGTGVRRSAGGEETRAGAGDRAGDGDSAGDEQVAGASRFSAAGLGDFPGEITGLLSEIGDLLARLIAALIAVLESIAAALRSTPAQPAQPRHYQPIAVRIVDAEGTQS